MPLKAAQYAKRQKNEILPKYGKIASRKNLAARELKPWERLTCVGLRIWAEFAFCSKRGVLSVMHPKGAQYPSEEKTQRRPNTEVC